LYPFGVASEGIFSLSHFNSWKDWKLSSKWASFSFFFETQLENRSYLAFLRRYISILHYSTKHEYHWYSMILFLNLSSNLSEIIGWMFSKSFVLVIEFPHYQALELFLSCQVNQQLLLFLNSKSVSMTTKTSRHTHLLSLLLKKIFVWYLWLFQFYQQQSQLVDLHLEYLFCSSLFSFLTSRKRWIFFMDIFIHFI